MRLIDRQYTKTRFYGWPRMTAFLRRQGKRINHKRVQRLMKYEGIYLRDYNSVPGPEAGLRAYFRFYNQERLHQSLSYLTPKEVYDA